MNLFAGDSLTHNWEPSSLINGDNSNDTILVSPPSSTTFYVNSFSLVTGCIINDSVTVYCRYIKQSDNSNN